MAASWMSTRAICTTCSSSTSAQTGSSRTAIACCRPARAATAANACLTCDKFATNRTHLDEHQRQLSGLLQIVDARREQFQRKTGREMPEDNVWLRERRKERRALQSIIAALDATAQTDQAVRGAGVQARLEEGRA